MVIDKVRGDLIQARDEIKQGRSEQAIQSIEHALEELDDRLLTTHEAQMILGLGSVNTLKLLVKKAALHVHFHGNRMMIPMSELRELQNSAVVRGLRTSDRLHAASRDIGAGGELSPEELDDLEEARPGSPPWSRVTSTTGD